MIRRKGERQSEKTGSIAVSMMKRREEQDVFSQHARAGGEDLCAGDVRGCILKPHLILPHGPTVGARGGGAAKTAVFLWAGRKRFSEPGADGESSRCARKCTASDVLGCAENCRDAGRDAGAFFEA